MTFLTTINRNQLRIDWTGKTLILSPSVEKPCCCTCEPCTLGSYVTNNQNREWDLRGYKCAGSNCSDRPWRLLECGANPTTSGGVVYNSGVSDAYGCLTGLPDKFTSQYYYNGYMSLELGCKEPTAPGGIKWPRPCGTGTCTCNFDCCPDGPCCTGGSGGTGGTGSTGGSGDYYN
jgi:hypothetical protein